MAEDTLEADSVAAATTSDGAASNAAGRPAWAVWLAWGWVALLALCAIAELAGWNDLRLALDFQRHFR